jgi:hypothetical protein
LLKKFCAFVRKVFRTVPISSLPKGNQNAENFMKSVVDLNIIHDNPSDDMHQTSRFLASSLLY